MSQAGREAAFVGNGIAIAEFPHGRSCIAMASYGALAGSCRDAFQRLLFSFPHNVCG